MFLYYRTLDYVFVSESITVRDAFVVPAIGGSSTDEKLSRNATLDQSLSNLHVDEPQPSEQWPSDHFLILTDLEL